MKTLLTIEQSEDLIRRGIAESKGHEFVWNEPCNKFSKCFRLQDLISILPKEIILDGKHLPLGMEFDEDYMAWTAYYLGCGYIETQIELIDALYHLLIWAIKNKYINHKPDNQ